MCIHFNDFEKERKKNDFPCVPPFENKRPLICKGKGSYFEKEELKEHKREGVGGTGYP